MGAAHRIFKKIQRNFHEPRYIRALPGILKTPVVPKGNMPFILVSMVQTRDVLSYLVAVKSFTRYANPRRIVIVCDPTITLEDRAVFSSHIPHVELRDAAEFTHENIPRGGTWERLYAISKYCQQEYVVQLDADTITMLPPTEVINAIMNNAGFVMSGEPSAVLMSLEETEKNIESWGLPGPGLEHIQVSVERSMANNKLPARARYVRGCSGFTGFPRSDSMTLELLAFSKTMHARHGMRWAEWGTEQITSNYLVANAEATTVLPFLLYGTPDVFHSDSVLIHFIGSLRFTSNKYCATTLETIRELTAPLTTEETDLVLRI
jgi:hypothetical protein